MRKGLHCAYTYKILSDKVIRYYDTQIAKFKRSLRTLNRALYVELVPTRILAKGHTMIKILRYTQCLAENKQDLISECGV